MRILYLCLPVRQVVIDKLKLEFVTSLFVSMFIAMLLAIVSWRLIEEPELRIISQKSGTTLHLRSLDSILMNRPGFSRYSEKSLLNAFETLPVTAYF